MTREMIGTYENAAIAAIATAPATGAVGIIRISGFNTAHITEKVFTPADGKGLLCHAPRTMIFGFIRNSGGELLDKALCVFMPGPNSYTGEDTAELHCHGGLALLSVVLAALINAGARSAQAGEFTKRAFLNGKMDLTEAEAVADLIAADWEGGVKNAAAQLTGIWGKKIGSIYDTLTDIASHYAAYIDYTDENVEPPDLSLFTNNLAQARDQLKSLLSHASAGKIVTDGIKTAIVGRPNVGKSSLFNAMLGYNRSIVTTMPGTTRDEIREKIIFGGVPLVLSDTAGIRMADAEAEEQGVLKAYTAASDAGLVLAIFDGSEDLTDEDTVIIEKSHTYKNVLCAINKADRTQNNETLCRLKSEYGEICMLSAKTGQGLDLLSERINKRCGMGDIRYDGSIVTNARQLDCLTKAESLVEGAHSDIAQGLPAELAWGDVNEAAASLGEILGRAVSDDIIEKIFSRFCVGK